MLRRVRILVGKLHYFFIGISIKMQSKHRGASAIFFLSILHFVRINFVLLHIVLWFNLEKKKKNVAIERDENGDRIESHRIASNQIDRIKCRTARSVRHCVLAILCTANAINSSISFELFEQIATLCSWLALTFQRLQHSYFIRSLKFFDIFFSSFLTRR